MSKLNLHSNNHCKEENGYRDFGGDERYMNTGDSVIMNEKYIVEIGKQMTHMV